MSLTSSLNNGITTLAQIEIKIAEDGKEEEGRVGDSDSERKIYSTELMLPHMILQVKWLDACIAECSLSR